MKAKFIDIETPIWKDRSVGLNVKGLEDNDVVVCKILYVDKKGKEIYPYHMGMSVRQLKVAHSRMMGTRNVPLYVVPIHRLHILTVEQLNTIKQKYDCV